MTILNQNAFPLCIRSHLHKPILRYIPENWNPKNFQILQQLQTWESKDPSPKNTKFFLPIFKIPILLFLALHHYNNLFSQTSSCVPHSSAKWEKGCLCNFNLLRQWVGRRRLGPFVPPLTWIFIGSLDYMKLKPLHCDNAASAKVALDLSAIYEQNLDLKMQYFGYMVFKERVYLCYILKFFYCEICQCALTIEMKAKHCRKS